MTNFEWVIRDALIIDGRGGTPYVGDVGTSGGKIAAIGSGLARGTHEISAKNRVLSPGFIDAHAHDDFSVFVDPLFRHKVVQGVTTSIVGNCGIGAAPQKGALSWIEKLHPGVHMPTWESHANFASLVEQHGPSIHLAVLAGHGSLRACAAEDAPRKLTASEMGRLLGLYEEALAAGVFGLSSGLIYEPGCHADAEELIELVRHGREVAPLYTTHLRSESNDLAVAVREALFIAESAGVGLELSHHKAHGRNNWGRVSETLALVDDAVSRGVDVWLDVYPYTAGSTILAAVASDISLGENSRVGQLFPEDLRVSASEKRPDLVGKNLGQVMTSEGLDKKSAVEWLLREDPGMWVILFAMSEEDVRKVLSHPRALIGSDGLPVANGKPHPRLFGTFPRVLGHYARDEALFELSEAVAKMTYRTARRFGIRDRGSIEVGMAADLVLFDQASVLDLATFDEPRESPRGIERVWVSGVLTLDAEGHTGARVGSVLRRKAGLERN